MSEYYQRLDAPHFDYRLVTQPGLPAKVRGPAVDLDRPFIACIGAAQTLGRFCRRPFPSMLAEALGMPVLNMAVGGSGPRHYRQPAYQSVLCRARLVIAQVLSARSASNSEWQTGDGGILGRTRRSGAMERLEPVIERFLATESRDFVAKLVAESRDDFTSDFQQLLEGLGVPSILFWFSERTPDHVDDFGSKAALMGAYPQLVNRAMVDAIRPFASDYVECVTSRGLPQRLWVADEAVEGTRRHPDGALYNHYYPSPEMHEDAFAALLPVCRRVLQSVVAPTVDTRPPAPDLAAKGAVPFLILAAERTGSNLLAGLLDSHPSILAGGELFNPFLTPLREVPWRLIPKERIEEFARMRDRDPVGFLFAIYQLALDAGKTAIGFKLMYGQGDELYQRAPAVRDVLSGPPPFRLIHLTRKNLVERFVSQRRAEQTGSWQTRVGKTTNDTSRPKLTVAAHDLVADLERVENWQRVYRHAFAAHPILEIEYEELAADPQGTARRCADFLGVPPVASFEVRYAKTGTDRLEDAIENLDDLRSMLRRWLDMLDGTD
jgi:LPS sulfotransferase NodH